MQTIKFSILLITSLLISSTVKAQTGKLVKTYSNKSELHEIVIQAYALVIEWQDIEKISENKRRFEHDLTERAVKERMKSIYSFYATEDGDLEIVRNGDLISISEFAKEQLKKIKSLDGKLSYLIANGITKEVNIYLNKEGSEEFLTNYYSNLDAIAQELIDKGKVENSRSSGQMFYNAQQEAYRRGLIKPLVDGIYDYNTYVPKVKTVKKK
jgi:hypothetical protein